MQRRSLFLFASLLLPACGGGGSSTPDAHVPPVDAPAPDASSPDAGPMSGVVQCPAALPAPSEGSCDVTAGTGTSVVVRGNILGAGVTYLDGSVVYDTATSKITYVGCNPPTDATAAVVTCAGAAVSPGLINAHDHETFDNRAPLAGTVAGGVRFAHRNEWRDAYATPPNQVTGAAGNQWNEIRQVFAGTTSINGSGGSAGLARNLDQPSAADQALGFAGLDYETFILNDQNVSTAPANCAWNYALTELQVAGFPALTTHTAEGIDDRARAELECVRPAPGLTGGRDYVEHNTGHIHAIAADAADYYDMALRHAKLIWSPRSNIALYGNTSEAQVMKRLGGTIALGTDWTYSGSATMLRELACASSFDDTYLGDSFTDEDLWKMATINAAQATSTDALIGSLEVGKLADVAVFHAQSGQTHAAVVHATDADTVLVVRDGKVLFGEDDVVAALDASCEQTTVCSLPRRICASRELNGTTYAALATTVAAASPPAYAAEICSPPADEPTCIPSRPNEYTGVAASGDMDGDGVPDASDDCPTVFNPIRPMDHGVQADVDGDGIGDACDPTPVGDDLDGDGILNAVDLCPFVPDAPAPETDTDGDGKGDACDACPSQANAAHACYPPYDSIVSIQNGTVPTNTNVFIHGTVTAVAYNGFFVQDPTAATPEYSGVFVFPAGSPVVAVGDDVAVAGKDIEFHGMTEVSNASILSQMAGGTVPAPASLTVAQAVDPKWDGVLVTLTDVSAINLAYSCTADDPNCHDTNLWLLNTTIVAWDAAFAGTTAQWTAAGTAYVLGTPMTGTIGFRFNRTHLFVRSLADLGQ